MLFNSIEFLIFLPIVFLLYWFIFKPLKWQNLLIVVSSYLFYGWWDWRFLLLIALTTMASYATGLWMGTPDKGKSQRQRATMMWANVALNIGILGVFKYYNFFTANFARLFEPFGWHFDWLTLDIILPVGISFYTFQALSYTVDVYRGTITPTRNVVAFTAFISFFPQLVAGPIERATNLLPQFLKSRTFDYKLAVDGMRQILWGLFKKMVVADNCAVVVNQVFADYATMSASQLWLGAILFTFQIYGDFSGYSDIAIGTAKLFGIRLMENFKLPYFSRDIAEFWRRWHISLTTWFRDYIYIPLGGSRCSKHKAIRNTFVIFLVSGLWHGANWTFVAWGAYHAMLFVPLLLLGRNRRYAKDSVVAQDTIFPSWKEAIAVFTTFALAVIGWVIFRATSISEAGIYIKRMFTQWHGLQMVSGANRCLLVIAILLFVEWIFRSRPHSLANLQTIPLMQWRPVRWCCYIIIGMMCLLYSAPSSAFIYFQF